MPRNMSFSLTTEQFKAKTKTVTRRVGWKFLNPGDLVMGCKKCMGLKPGEAIERLGMIKIKSVRREDLSDLLFDPYYGASEVIKEGFPHMTPKEFVEMFVDHMRGDKNQEVTRIEFEHI